MKNADAISKVRALANRAVRKAESMEVRYGKVGAHLELARAKLAREILALLPEEKS